MSIRSSELRVLGLSGGCAPTQADHAEKVVERCHDSAAVLICDGVVVAGIEEERLDRIKHSWRLARRAITGCLDIAGIALADVTHIAYYGREDLLDRQVAARPHPPGRRWTAREYLASALSQEFDADVDPTRVVFVEHHVAHAASAYHVGPFADALVVTLDGIGDRISGTIWTGERGELRRLRDIQHRDSLGELYVRTIVFLGYQAFDEYKVMGLAPYGDPSRFRPLFERICVLQPNGGFALRLGDLPEVVAAMGKPRRFDEPITDVHCDLAAALQETVERATLHLVSHYHRKTGLRHLCLAGGVAHNSTMIGKIARAGLFDGVFVQPASHDAGCALGAAAHAHRMVRPDRPIQQLSDVYWGRPMGTTSEVGARLVDWATVVNVERLADVAAATAALLAEGAVLGWVQGRSEFGPRALGNRSILADARPADNKARINALVKEREGYRPFAPAVLEEHADVFFEVPSTISAAFMTLTVPVRPSARALLGAVTHVDGSARVQTVARATNPRFWALLEAFRQLTGVPILLNTSFNHSGEPIVDSIDDAVTCMLTTGLTHLVVDEYLVTKRPDLRWPVWHLIPRMPEYIRATHRVESGEDGMSQSVYRCEHLQLAWRTRSITPAAFHILERADGRRTLGELADDLPAMDFAQVVAEFHSLWTLRMLQFGPLTGARMSAPARSQQSLPVA